MKPMKRDLDNFICQLCASRYRMVTCRFISHLSFDTELMKYQANKRILFKSNFFPFFLLIIVAFCARKDFEHFLAVIFMNNVCAVDLGGK